MRKNINKKTLGTFLLLSVMMVGIFTLSGCLGQEEGEEGILVTLTIQPHPLIPTRTTAYTLTDYRSHSSWANSIALEGNKTAYRWTDGKTPTYNRIIWEWDVGYPGALKQLRYDVEVSGDGIIYEHSLRIYERDGGESTIFYILSNTTTNGTWTAISDVHWIDGKVIANYEFEEAEPVVYTAAFDVMLLEFNPITEEHFTTRQITETGVYYVLLFTVKQNDVSVTISEIPTDYQLIQIIPEGSYRSISNNIASTGKLTIDGCSLGTYNVVLNETSS